MQIEGMRNEKERKDWNIHCRNVNRLVVAAYPE